MGRWYERRMDGESIQRSIAAASAALTAAKSMTTTFTFISTASDLARYETRTTRDGSDD